MKRPILPLLLWVPLSAGCTSEPEELVPVIVRFSDPVDVTAFQDPDRAVRRARMVDALQAQANVTQRALQHWLRREGALAGKPLWLINGVAAKVRPEVVRALENLPGVRSVVPDPPMHAPVATPGAPSAPEWNLRAIHAPPLWTQGVDGTGAVVANLDTGVDLGHADLRDKWRGGTDSWWDPHRHTTVPYDVVGHGTQTMGIMLGGDASGSVIGVAPGARWIAAKIYDDNGNTRASVIHEAFQWLLMPSGNPAAPDAPDVVSASWDLEAVGACDTTFESDLQALRSAGIVVVFAAGNSGPQPSTSVSPANNQDGFSAGAIDESNDIGLFSSRGASSCTHGIFPDTVAPGVNVKTASVSLGGVPQYTYVSGTSFSAPHVAGVAALLVAAFPDVLVADLEQTLRRTAYDLGPVGPDDTYGYGLVDAYAAYAAIASTHQERKPTLRGNHATE